MSKDWMELLFGNAINTGGLDAKTKLLLTLAGLMMQGVSNDMAFRQTIRHLKEAEVSDQEITETIAFMSVFAGMPAMSRAMTLAGAVLTPKKEEDQ
jgi:4-carboxymuconolactone decarboxylase